MTDTVSQETAGKAEIPATWAWSEIGSVAELIRGVSYKKSDASTSPRPDLTPILRANNIGDGRLNFDELVYVPPQAISEKQYVRALDVVIAMSSGSKKLVGKAGQATSDYGCGFGAFCGLVRSSELLDKKYVGLFFQSEIYKKAISKLSSGVNINNLRRQHIENMPMPLAPLNEQRRIVEKIEELFTKLDAGVRSLKQTQALLKSYRRSVLKAAVEGELSREWREAHRGELEPASELLERILQERREKFAGKKYKEPSSPAPSKLPSLPAGWTWVTVDQLTNVGTGATPLKSNRAYYEAGTIPWVTSGALNSLFVSDCDQKITEVALRETNTKLFPKNTLLVAMYGEGKTRGKVSELLIEAATNQACAALTFDDLSEKCRPYVKLFFQKNYNDIRRLSAGGVQPNLNLSIVKSTAVPLPPLAEQHFIVEEIERRLSVVDKLVATVEENLKQASGLRQSILKQAFSGELVPQDADDEPAGALLERIWSERRAADRRGKRVRGAKKDDGAQGRLI